MKYVTGNLNQPLNLQGHVVIVGSSGRMCGRSWGSIIDEADEVIRFNRAPTIGFEHMVGSKTTLRAVNNHVFDNIDISSQGFPNQPRYFIKNLKNERILYIGPDIGPFINQKENSHPSCELWLFAYNAVDQFKSELPWFSSPKQMTVGGIAIGLCVINNIVPTLVGFDTEPGPRTHYYEDRPEGNPSHSINEEQQWLLKLEKEKKIKILR